MRTPPAQAPSRPLRRLLVLALLAGGSFGLAFGLTNASKTESPQKKRAQAPDKQVPDVPRESAGKSRDDRGNDSQATVEKSPPEVSVSFLPTIENREKPPGEPPDGMVWVA